MAISDSGGNDLMLVTGASGFVGSAIAISARWRWAPRSARSR